MTRAELIKDNRFQEIISLVSKNKDVEAAKKLKEKLPFIDFIELDDSILFIIWGEDLDGELCTEEIIAYLKEEGMSISSKKITEDETYRFYSEAEKPKDVEAWVDDIIINDK